MSLRCFEKEIPDNNAQFFNQKASKKNPPFGRACFLLSSIKNKRLQGLVSFDLLTGIQISFSRFALAIASDLLFTCNFE